jgi:hypothetical protein
LPSQLIRRSLNLLRRAIGVNLLLQRVEEIDYTLRAVSDRQATDHDSKLRNLETLRETLQSNIAARFDNIDNKLRAVSDRQAADHDAALQGVENLREILDSNIELLQKAVFHAEGERLAAPSEYTTWFQSITGVPLKSPTFLPAMSWTLDSIFGRYVNNAMVEAEVMCVTELLAEQQRNGIPGSIVEFGVFEGAWLERLHAICEKLNFSREIYGFDSFEGLPEPDTVNDLDGWKKGDYAAPYDTVAKKLNIAKRPKIHLVPGWFSDSLLGPEAQGISEISFARIDCDLYEPAVECLQYLAPRLTDGSILVFDDWTFDAFRGETKAFAEWVPQTPHLKFQFLFFTSQGHFYFRVRH